VADIDPADQWVLDPETGSYEFRPDGVTPAPERAPAPPSAPARPGRGRGSHRAPRGPGRGPVRSRALVWGAGALGLLLMGGGVTGYLVYRHLDSNITTIDVGDVGSKSVTARGPLDILLLGTDSRRGLGRRYGDAGSVGHADTTILLHVSRNRTSAVALSIPRDLITDVPDCPTRRPDGSVVVVPGRRGVRFNTSLGQQGRDPGCAMRTVEKLTGIRPDHFMMADFAAVKDLSTAVGGVEVCLAKDIDDKGGSGLRLRKGRHLVEGEQALAFVRTRHSVGFGGDLDRIRLQQQFLGSLVRNLKSGGTIDNPSKLWRLADAATRALTVDTGIGTVRRLSDLVRDLSAVGTRDITFTTVPVVDNPADGPVHSTVVLDNPTAQRVFRLIAADGSVTEMNAAVRPPRATAVRSQGARSAPSSVTVEVFNGNGMLGAARSTVGWLRGAEGVTAARLGGNAPVPAARTTLAYVPRQAAQARELAALMGLPAAALIPDAPGTAGSRAAAPPPMALTLGRDFRRPGLAIAAPTAAPSAHLQEVEASDRDNCAK
jgi:LCP family protein required for cell wall assembly